MFLLFHCRFDHNIKYVPQFLKKGGGVYVKGGGGEYVFYTMFNYLCQYGL